MKYRCDVEDRGLTGFSALDYAVGFAGGEKGELVRVLVRCGAKCRTTWEWEKGRGRPEECWDTYKMWEVTDWDKGEEYGDLEGSGWDVLRNVDESLSKKTGVWKRWRKRDIDKVVEEVGEVEEVEEGSIRSSVGSRGSDTPDPAYTDDGPIPLAEHIPEESLTPEA